MMKCISSLVLLLSLAGTISANIDADDINALDAQGRRTGYWIINGSMKPTPGFASEQVIEEGDYLSNKKQGLWKRYYSNGKIQSEITYKDNIPNGPYSTYYPSGINEEKGTWSYNKNIGIFARYHSNGAKSQAFVFDDNGVRNGQQFYYHENGKTELEVYIRNGMEEGIMRRYYANGDIQETKDYTGGKLKEGSIQEFTMVTKQVQVKEEIAVANKQSSSVSEDKPNISVFNHTGDNILYNKDRLISQKGYFKNGRLWDGKWYSYSPDGILEQIEVYRDGKFIGLAPLVEADR